MTNTTPTFCPSCVRHTGVFHDDPERCGACGAVLLGIIPDDAKAAEHAASLHAWHRSDPLWDLIIEKGYATNERHARRFYNKHIKPGWQWLDTLSEILDKWRTEEWELGQMSYYAKVKVKG